MAAKKTVGRRTVPGGPNAFLDHKHPVYVANQERWEQNEARLAGGDDVLDELLPFVWETDPTKNLRNRKNQAIYINFPEIYCAAITGHLLRFAPKPGANLDFGGLGKVNESKSSWSRADMIYANPDGPGNTGSSWDLWWADTLKLAIATGHRWVFVESPSEEPTNVQDEQDGLRPYLVEYSPLDVPNWRFSALGELEFAVIRFWEYDIDARLQHSSDDSTMAGYSYMLVTAEGFTGFGGRFAAGGWWKYTPEKDQYDTGTFDDTLGKIPMFPLYYERSKGTRKRPAISRSGITELGQAAIAAMNVGSAANFNAVDSGSGLTWMLGVDEDGQELAVGQINRGDRFIGLTPNQDTDQTPQIATSGQNSVQSTVFDTRENAIWQAAIHLGISEATGSAAADGPGNSGSAQQAKFGSNQAPRIVKVAANLQNAQNISLDFLHLRFGIAEPSGSSKWPKKFDLVELIDRIKQFFEVQRLAGVSSPTLDAAAMVQVAEEKGLLNDATLRAKVEAEYNTSAEDKALAAKTRAEGGQAGGTIQAPQSESTQIKKKARQAGEKQDKAGPGKSPGGLKP